MFPCSPAISNAAMTYRNIELRIIYHMKEYQIPSFCLKNRLKIGQEIAEIFQNREPDFQHVGKCIAKYHMLF